MGRGRARSTLELIAAMRDILEGIQPASVRAVAYQCFNRKLIPSMKDVTKVSRLLVITREEGTIPWSWIVDPTREVEVVPSWDDPENFAAAVMRQYRRDKWRAQPYHVEVWSEKSTVAGTLRPVLQQYEVDFQSVHGWTSATAVHAAARDNGRREQATVILYVGDWDPSGMGMSEMDLPRRLAKYSRHPVYDDDELTPETIATILRGAQLTIKRIALTEEDTRRLDAAVAFPASDKRSDTRYPWFTEHYGARCWELDAMSPAALRDRVKQEIRALIDKPTWRRYVRAEKAEARSIRRTCRTWTGILNPARKYAEPA